MRLSRLPIVRTRFTSLAIISIEAVIELRINFGSYAVAADNTASEHKGFTFRD